jgi:hypothetical protein
MRIRAILLLVVSALCGCAVPTSVKAAKLGCDAFHDLMDREEYSSIYILAQGGFRGITSEQLTAFLRRVNRKLGRCSSATDRVGGVVAATSGITVTITSSRTCASGPLQEQLVWRMMSGRTTLVGYKAISPLLLTD